MEGGGFVLVSAEVGGWDVTVSAGRNVAVASGVAEETTDGTGLDVGTGVLLGSGVQVGGMSMGIKYGRLSTWPPTTRIAIYSITTPKTPGSSTPPGASLEFCLVAFLPKPVRACRLPPGTFWRISRKFREWQQLAFSGSCFMKRRSYFSTLVG